MSPIQPMPTSYDGLQVALSVLIAIAASYAALDLGGRVTSVRGRSQLIWLTCGATSMGIGIWAMHYVGTLALRLPVPARYHWPTVLLSLAVGVLCSGFALKLISQRRMGR
ncbi:MAG TPA: MHYT domain-containing protein, partial [Candidatus Sulfotelmatobacter sp.]|nr:MHYT domain-containing protein [Candidatus Sulfotelmatobacter sp.]